MAATSTSKNTNTLTQRGIWPNRQSDYEIGEVIGVGATAVVYSALCIPLNERCAIKRINLEKWNTPMEDIHKEIQVMSSCYHVNVVTYYTSFVVKDELWLILRLLEGGSLLDIIKHKMKISNCKYGVFDEATIATVLKEVLTGLEYFHNNGKIHRDIKAGNILMGEDGTVQIGDFGVSAWLSTDRDLSRQKLRHTFVGTPCWMAPEVMEQNYGYDFKADIWSFGITAIEMATGTAPYHKYSPMKVIMLTLQNDSPNLDTVAEEKDQYKVYGKTFREMIDECLQKDPTKRPTAAELLKHPFFKKAKDINYLKQTLVATGPSMEVRAQKAIKRHSGSWAHLHLTLIGEWAWSDDEDEDLDNAVGKPMNELHHDSTSDDEEEESNVTAEISDAPDIINFVLRIRNNKNKLNDIRFAFTVGKDTSSDIAKEMVSAGLIDPLDTRPIALSIARLLLWPETKTVTFHLNSAPSTKAFDEKTLTGYAQLFIDSTE